MTSTIESLISMRARQVCCSHVRPRLRRPGRDEGPSKTGAAHAPFPAISTLSMKTLTRVAKAKARDGEGRRRQQPEPERRTGPGPGARRGRARRWADGRRARHSGPGAKARQTPVNPGSNSGRDIRRGPLAGSTTQTRPFRMPSTTMKCSKLQWTTSGNGRSNSWLGAQWKPPAISPHSRAARITRAALQPSRDTPQRTRSSSSDIQRPWCGEDHPETGRARTRPTPSAG